MKFRSLFLSVLCGLAVSSAFTSCSDDDDDYDDEEEPKSKKQIKNQPKEKVSKN